MDSKRSSISNKKRHSSSRNEESLKKFHSKCRDVDDTAEVSKPKFLPLISRGNRKKMYLKLNEIKSREQERNSKSNFPGISPLKISQDVTLCKSLVTSGPSDVKDDANRSDSLMSLDLSFKSQEEDDSSDITKLPKIPVHSDSAEHSFLQTSAMNTSSNFDQLYMSEASFFVDVTQPPPFFVPLTKSSTDPEKEALSASATWSFDEASYSGTSLNNIDSRVWSSSTNYQKEVQENTGKSLHYESPICFSEIPLPPDISLKSPVHISELSKKKSLETRSPNTVALASLPEFHANNYKTLDKVISPRKLNFNKKDKLSKSIAGIIDGKKSFWDKWNPVTSESKSHPKVRLPFLSRNNTRINMQEKVSPAALGMQLKISSFAKARPYQEKSSEWINESSADRTPVKSSMVSAGAGHCLTKSCPPLPGCSTNDKSSKGFDHHTQFKSWSQVDLRAGAHRHQQSVNVSHKTPLESNAKHSFAFSLGQFLQRKRANQTTSFDGSDMNSSSDTASDMASPGMNTSHSRSVQDLTSLSKEVYSVGFIDTHCHLDFLFNKVNHSGNLSDFKIVMEKKSVEELKFPASYEGCIAVFCQPDSFHKTMWYKRLLQDDQVWGAFGCHPHFSNHFREHEMHHLKQALAHPKVVALGEIGLDYSHKNNVDVEVQQAALKMQLAIAVELKKPLVIHCRDAHDDTLQILKQHVPADTPMHRHCFTDTWDEAYEWLQAFPNCFIGFTNIISLRNRRGKLLGDVIRKMPLNRLLLETDAPFFTPDCVREQGECNAHPGYALHVAVEMARLRGVSVDDILVATRRNTREIYGI